MVIINPICDQIIAIWGINNSISNIDNINRKKMKNPSKTKHSKKLTKFIKAKFIKIKTNVTFKIYFF